MAFCVMCGRRTLFCRIVRYKTCAKGRVISFSMFDGLVTGMMASAVAAVADEKAVTELRMRVGRPLVVLTAEGRSVARMPSGAPFIVRGEDIERVLALASDFSVYAVNDQLVKGFMARRGIRIGVAGEGVVEGGSVLTMKHIAFLTVRIPHEVRGAADGIKMRYSATEGCGTLWSYLRRTAEKPLCSESLRGSRPKGGIRSS